MASLKKEIFKLTTKDGFIIKQLGEFLSFYTQQICFNINQDNLSSIGTDGKKDSVLIDFVISKDKCAEYYCNSPLKIGIKTSFFHKILKIIKKKDLVTLFIQENKSNELGIGVQKMEGSHSTVTNTFMKIINITPIETEIPEGYNNPIVIIAKEFQQMIKNMNNIGKTLEVKNENGKLNFSCTGDDLYSRELSFEDNSNVEQKVKYCENFDTQTLSPLSKIAGLSSYVKIYCHNEMPLKISLDIGSLGSLNFYVKSKKVIDEENLDNQ